MTCRRLQGGFNLVELSVVLVILALLSGAGSRTYELVSQARAQTANSSRLIEANQAIRSYVARHKRLPCPDSRSNAQIAAGTPLPAACPVALTRGWFPYHAVGMEMPREGIRLFYGVQRTTAADLVQPKEIVSGEFASLDGASALIESLKLLAKASPSTALPYYKHPAPLAPDSSATAVIDCGTAGETINPAYVIIAPAKDLDRIGTIHPEFDDENSRFVSQQGSTLCFAHPNRPSSFRYDDLVVVESPIALLGWLTRLER